MCDGECEWSLFRGVVYQGGVPRREVVGENVLTVHELSHIALHQLAQRQAAVVGTQQPGVVHHDQHLSVHGADRHPRRHLLHLDTEHCGELPSTLIKAQFLLGFVFRARLPLFERVSAAGSRRHTATEADRGDRAPPIAAPKQVHTRACGAVLLRAVSRAAPRGQAPHAFVGGGVVSHCSTVAAHVERRG